MRMPQIASIAVLGLAALTACGSESESPGAAAAATQSAEASPATADPASQESGPPLTRRQARFVADVRKHSDDVAGDSDGELVEDGRDFCAKGSPFSPRYGYPPTVEDIYNERDQFGAVEKYAVLRLCPKLIGTWKQGMAAFQDGDQVVGKGIRAGSYRTLEKKVKGCYWERTARGGDTIANRFVTFAASGVTVTIQATDGGFTSKDCGLWVPVI